MFHVKHLMIKRTDLLVESFFKNGIGADALERAKTKRATSLTHSDEHGLS